MPNRHERRKAKGSPKVMEIIIGGVKLTFTPATIERVWKEWEADHPGRRAATDMSPKEFGDRCMRALIDGGRPMQSGNA